jgi:hypothetical protein
LSGFFETWRLVITGLIQYQARCKMSTALFPENDPEMTGLRRQPRHFGGTRGGKLFTEQKYHTEQIYICQTLSILPHEQLSTVRSADRILQIVYIQQIFTTEANSRCVHSASSSFVSDQAPTSWADNTHLCHLSPAHQPIK